LLLRALWRVTGLHLPAAFLCRATAFSGFPCNYLIMGVFIFWFYATPALFPTHGWIRLCALLLHYIIHFYIFTPDRANALACRRACRTCLHFVRNVTSRLLAL